MRGNLEAAQQALAAFWPLLNVLRDAQPTPGVTTAEAWQAIIKRTIEDAQRELAPLYSKAMGDL